MSYGLSTANTRMKLLAGAIMLCAGMAGATSAMSTTVYGGGGTLSAGGYVGWSFVTPSDPTHDRLTLPANVDAHSLFGAFAGTTNGVQYCQTGSGGGKKILNGDTSGTPSLSATGVCGNFAGTTVTTGFSEPSTALVQPDFVSSDAPLAAAEYATFVTNKGTANGEPIQFPAVVGSIAVIYKNSDSAVGSKINLSEAQVCGIFAGTITDWHTLNSAFASKPIKVAFRSDGSGTTFSLANHLTSSCAGVITSGHFVADQAFITVAAAGLPIASSTTTLPANGNPSVVHTVSITDGAIGYAETANALHPASGDSINFATVNNQDPVTGLANSIAVTTTLDKVLGAPNTTTGAPTLVAQTPNSTVGCLGIVDPATYAAPTSGYSIIAVSYLLGNQKGNGTDLTTVRGLLSSTFGAHTGVTTIGSGTGYAFLTSSGINTGKIISCTAA